MAHDPSDLYDDILDLVARDLDQLRRAVGKGPLRKPLDRDQRSRLRELEFMVANRLRADRELEALQMRDKGALTREESLQVVEQLLRTDPDVRARAAAILRAS